MDVVLIFYKLLESLNCFHLVFYDNCCFKETVVF